MTRQKLPDGARHTMETIAARCIEEGDCMLWDGAIANPSKPVLQDGRKVVAVRRYIFTELLGKKVKPRHLVSFTCDNDLCVHEDHIDQMTRSEMLKRAVERTQYHLRPDRTAKLQIAARERSQYGADLVDQVRNEEGSYTQIAERLGLKKSFVADVRSQRHWKPTNPFVGLGARPAANDSTERKRA